MNKTKEYLRKTMDISLGVGFVFLGSYLLSKLRSGEALRKRIERIEELLEVIRKEEGEPKEKVKDL